MRPGGSVSAAPIRLRRWPIGLPARGGSCEPAAAPRRLELRQPLQCGGLGRGGHLGRFRRPVCRGHHPCSDPRSAALLCHLGRAIITRVRLAAGSGTKTRCQSSTAYSMDSLCAAPGLDPRGDRKLAAGSLGTLGDPALHLHRQPVSEGLDACVVMAAAEPNGQRALQLWLRGQPDGRNPQCRHRGRDAIVRPIDADHDDHQPARLLRDRPVGRPGGRAALCPTEHVEGTRGSMGRRLPARRCAAGVERLLAGPQVAPVGLRLARLLPGQRTDRDPGQFGRLTRPGARGGSVDPGARGDRTGGGAPYGPAYAAARAALTAMDPQRIFGSPLLDQVLP